MRFEADLELTVDGTDAHISGHGASLVVDSADPARLLRSASGRAGPFSRRELGRMADGLAARGASVRLQGPRGHVLTAGADADARVLRLFTGTRHVVPGSARGALAVASTLRPAHWRRLVWGTLTAVVAVAIARRAQRS